MAVLNHYNIRRVVDIYASVQDRDLGAVGREIMSIVDGHRKSLPRGSIFMTIRGQIDTMKTSYFGLLAGLGFAIVLVYLLIVVNFQSWLDPFIIITALPAPSASRTLLVEVAVDNRGGQLLSGAYVRVHLKLPQTVSSVTVPANTLLFRSEGLRVGVVRKGQAELVAVTIGRDYGSSVEVVSGLQPTDPVIVNPSDSLISGTTVQVSAPAAQAAAR